MLKIQVSGEEKGILFCLGFLWNHLFNADAWFQIIIIALESIIKSIVSKKDNGKSFHFILRVFVCFLPCNLHSFLANYKTQYFILSFIIILFTLFQFYSLSLAFRFLVLYVTVVLFKLIICLINHLMFSVYLQV